MVQSKNKTDKRYINLHRVGQALISGTTMSQIDASEEPQKEDA